MWSLWMWIATFRLQTASLLQAMRSIKFLSPICCTAQLWLDGIPHLRNCTSLDAPYITCFFAQKGNSPSKNYQPTKDWLMWSQRPTRTRPWCPPWSKTDRTRAWTKFQQTLWRGSCLKKCELVTLKRSRYLSEAAYSKMRPWHKQQPKIYSLSKI